MSAPKLAIHCITYNHEPYIRECLEGFVMQQTDFPFIAIVHDDASTDGTAAIVREYAARYPDIIKPIIETENKYSTGQLTQVMLDAIKATGAEYVAYCEGDDYWTDPHKLQKQVDFLDSHPDYMLAGHLATAHHQDGTKPDEPIGIAKDCDFIPGDLLPINFLLFIPTPTIMLRSKILFTDYYKRLSSIKGATFGDSQLFTAAYYYGKIYNMSIPMCVYRVVNNGACSRIKANPWPQIRTWIRYSKRVSPHCKKIYQKYKMPPRFGTILMRWDIFPDNLKAAGRIFWFTPFYTIKHIIIATGKFISNGFKFKQE